MIPPRFSFLQGHIRNAVSKSAANANAHTVANAVGGSIVAGGCGSGSIAGLAARDQTNPILFRLAAHGAAERVAAVLEARRVLARQQRQDERVGPEAVIIFLALHQHGLGLDGHLADAAARRAAA